MSNLFDVANKNVQVDVGKKSRGCGLLLKQGKVSISIKALTKVGFFSSLGPWDEKRVRVYGNAIKATRSARAQRWVSSP